MSTREPTSFWPVDTHVPTLNTKTDNNHPYNQLYHFALPTDLLQYQYQCVPMYLQSFHVTNVTNTRWSSILCQFQTSHIPLRLPDIILMIWSDQHINNIGISVTLTPSTHIGVSSASAQAIVLSLSIVQILLMHVSIYGVGDSFQLCNVLFSQTYPHSLHSIYSVFLLDSIRTLFNPLQNSEKHRTHSHCDLSIWLQSQFAFSQLCPYNIALSLNLLTLTLYSRKGYLLPHSFRSCCLWCLCWFMTI